MNGFSLTLATKNTFDGWIDFEDGSKLKIDYPTLPQNAKINAILLRISGMPKDEARVLTQEYMRLFIKYSVKDWEIKNAPKCQLTRDDKGDTELRDDLWYMLCDSIPQTAVIINKISSELELDALTKKK